MTSPSSGDPNVRVTEAVISAKHKKKSIGRQFKDVFIGGDSRTVVRYVFNDILVPQAKELITEAISSGFEKLIFGESRGGRRHLGSRPPQGNYTNYAARYGQRGSNPIGRSEREQSSGRPPATMQSNMVDEILLASRSEADIVLEHMYDLLRDYENVSVADLYSLVGWSTSHTDYKWGWTSLVGSGIQRVRDGYILIVPKPIPLD